MPIKIVGYLGPAGTFTEQALLTQPDLASAARTPFRTVPDVLDAVSSGAVDVGLVPIENSIEGLVTFTQDALAFDYDLFIQREVVLEIHHCLVAAPDTRLADIRTVASIPVAASQCHVWMRTSLPEAEVHAATSTADAAAIVSQRAAAGDRSWGAIAPSTTAPLYGLSILAEDIADHSPNQTRFVVVGRDTIAAPSGHDRTGLVVYQRADEPGSLISILQEFAARRINLSHVSSRPTKRGGLGNYCFVIYAEGHITDAVLADAMRDLRAKQGGLKFLGSYPAAGERAHSARDDADARWRDADDWMNALLARVNPPE
jgi:prephenate dehydratase